MVHFLNSLNLTKTEVGMQYINVLEEHDVLLIDRSKVDTHQKSFNPNTTIENIGHTSTLKH